MRSRHIRNLKSSPPLSRKARSRQVSALVSKYSGDDDDQDPGNPLKDIKFRSGCTGGAETASDGTYLSGFTATCIVDGVDWVPYVFDQFLHAEFSEKGKENEPLPIYTSFIGCQVPAHQ
ncbi:hypothetical protein EX895_006077 [Sporisorium graminicola]|uniref:Uncharacterized protein n=1 Tax=Sporisorium graminicola TaxID=280036 RepID=A0A4U7KMG3_9BASI|nr:hypothetical protein EX895_006077 [Sporisorium graminicola]TKY84997.1 hypothetical protein EX895_006077 [Sporisorium graminicola]